MGIRFNGQDLGGSLDDFINMAREFGEKMKEMAPEMGPIFESCCGAGRGDHHGPGRPDHPYAYSYPPLNSYTTRDGSLVFEFALAGIDESAVSVTFQGDYLVLSARAAPRQGEAEEGRFFKRGFTPRDIDRQRYRVSAEEYAQDLAKAVSKNGVLTVTIPLKLGEGIKINIVKEGN